MGKFGTVVAHMEAQTPAEAERSLRAAGILDKEGKLAKKYRSGKSRNGKNGSEVDLD
jgi:hypothetical protein